MMGAGSGLPSYTMPPTSGAPGFNAPATTGTPGYATPPTSGAANPGYATAPTSGTPGYTAPPASGTLGYTAPPASGTPGYATSPTSGAANPGYATPPTSGAPSFRTPPTSGVPGAAAPGWGIGAPASQNSWGRPAAPPEPPADPTWALPGGPVWDNPNAAPTSSGPSWNAPSGTYSSGATSGAVPQQRGEGTVYGNESPVDMTVPVTMNPAVENSGSLTGHILSQGWDFGADTGRRSNVKVGVAMLLVLLVLVGISVVFLMTVGAGFTDMLNGVLGKE